MGIINLLFSKSIGKRVDDTVRNVLTSALSAMQIIRGMPVYGNNKASDHINRGYLKNEDVYAIVDYISGKAASVPFYVYKVKNERKLKEYQRLVKSNDYSPESMARIFTTKELALEVVNEDHEFQVLLDKPNEEYAKFEFYQGCYVFKLLTGNTYVYTPILEFGPDAGKVAEMHLSPTNYTTPIIVNTYPKRIEAYQVTITGEPLRVEPSEMLHVRNFNPDFTYQGNELIGLSPLHAGNKVLQLSEDETNYRVAALQNAGADGIVSRKDITDDDGKTAETLGKMKTDYYSQAGGIPNAKKAFWSVGEWSYTKIGINPVEMDVLNSQVKTFKKLCNLFHLWDGLFNNGEASTESNVKEMRRAAWTDAILPQVYALRDGLNGHLVPKFNRKGETYYIDCDLSDIVELRQDLKTMMEAYSASPVIVPNVILVAQGQPRSSNPIMDKPLIKQGYAPIEDMETVPDVEDTGDYGK